MQQARRLIITLAGVAFWCVAATVAATTVAYAQIVPVPGGEGPVEPPPPPQPPPIDTPMWKFALVAAVAALLTVAVVGLVASLRQPRRSRPSGMLHA
jgi:hypothetical protein